MTLLHIALDQVDEARLQALVTAGAPESRTIDYKRTSYGNANADYSEFLADTSSFANTSGGDLVLGMDATNGVPTAVVPLTCPVDPEILRLEQIARGGHQPSMWPQRFSRCDRLRGTTTPSCPSAPGWQAVPG
jgi:Putative DNA-binding domain